MSEQDSCRVVESTCSQAGESNQLVLMTFISGPGKNLAENTFPQSDEAHQLDNMIKTCLNRVGLSGIWGPTCSSET